MKKKTNISVQDVRGIRRTPDLILGDKVVKNVSGDIMDANATEELVNDKIAEVIGTAPEILDTLGEIVQELETKADKSDLDEKADKSDLEDYVAKDEFEEHLDELNDDEKVIAAALNDLEYKKADKSDLDEKVDKAENITYALLVSKRDQNELIPGQTYRITDYVTTTSQANTQSAGHQFDVIVVANDINKLNENAYATLHSGDTYFANSNLAAWELKYCLDNNTNRFAWADSTNGKGVIYYMKDEFNNECPYDFKNIQYVFILGFSYRQYGMNSVFERYTSNDTVINDTAYYGFIRKSYEQGPPPPPEYLWSSTLRLSTTMSLYTISENNVSSYTDGSISGVALDEFTTFTFDQIGVDASLNGLDYSVYNNIIKEYITGLLSMSERRIQQLNVIYFRNKQSSTILSAHDNIFVANCYYNSFGSGCYSNTFGNDCYHNTFGNNCYSNTFGDNCYYNSFGSGCSSNTFGNSYYYNSFVDQCTKNFFGNSCAKNSFGNKCYSNFFGNDCYHNTFGDNCAKNSFGNDCNYITFSKQYTHYVIVENGNNSITLTSTQTTSIADLLRNITIAQGVKNIFSTIPKTISHDTVDDTFKTTYQPANSQTKSV